jgi:serine O-acetyltransferase
MEPVSQAHTLLRFVSHQLESLFPAFGEKGLIDIQTILVALRRTHACINKIKTAKNGFEYLNSSHYATFLYFLSNECSRLTGGLNDAKRVFLLNKALNGIDLFYEIQMPDVFVLGHTVGMVFAKATYGSHCVFHQGCTVGRDREDRPILERGVVLYPNSSVIGSCRVRENTVLAPGVQLVNRDTPGNCIVFLGEKGQPFFKPVKEYYADRYLSA